MGFGPAFKTMFVAALIEGVIMIRKNHSITMGRAAIIAVIQVVVAFIIGLVLVAVMLAVLAAVGMASGGSTTP